MCQRVIWWHLSPTAVLFAVLISVADVSRTTHNERTVEDWAKAPLFLGHEVSYGIF